MKFNNPWYENEELAYEDVFLFQNYFEGKSRLEIDVHPEISLNTHIPIVVANMNAVAGKRMAETMARYGGLVVLPQDMDTDTMKRIILHIKGANVSYDTPIIVEADDTIRDALGLMYKRAHQCVILVDKNKKPISLFKPKDFYGYDQFTLLGNLLKGAAIVAEDGISDEDAFMLMEKHGVGVLPIVNKKGSLIGILTKKQTIRNSIYQPTLDTEGRLDVTVALGINNFEEKAKIMFDLGVRTFVLDTAHGYQKNMIDAIKKCRKLFGDKVKIVAGNVITAEATKALLEAGADGVKVGIGPGAMCTTRIKTGVGRPQFTAVYKCAQEAKKHGGFVWADGGIKEPRDMILALAAGANHAMLGTIFAGTYESVGDIKYDEQGNMYKENYGMASKKAVFLRNQGLSKFELARKQMFREGISTSKIYLKEGRASVGDIVDEFIAGLRSAMTYVGAANLSEFHEKAIIGVQTQAGFVEGTPHGRVKK
ncbi:hypothetical protein P148_SR1C00001G0788 [candidate division SR1 bacterium RAAC1_SR1_1]|nr:hypothetical protein P148_SR1C00001G0788 [candidate division SR1 bacterium RAAC1_SR1_1]